MQQIVRSFRKPNCLARAARISVNIAIWTAFLFNAYFAQAQGEANIWYFGVNAGVDFNYNPPIALTNSAMVANEGTAVISDASGQLLF